MLLTIAAAILASTTPTAATATPAPAPAPKVATVNDNPRVCFVDEVTGSHLRRKTCKRLAEWRAEGIDPFETR